MARVIRSVAVLRATAPRRSIYGRLCSQASRISVKPTLGLAAAGVGLLAPAQAWANCSIVGFSVVCDTTTTTNTSYGTNTPDDRNYPAFGDIPFSVTVNPEQTVDGYGLAASNIGSGGVVVVNNGVAIFVNAGNAPTAGGIAALSVRAAGGALSYSGTGDILNNGTGNGLDLVQTGGGSVTAVIDGDVSSVTGDGINITSNGGVDLTTNGFVSGDPGVVITDNSAVGINYNVNSNVSATDGGIVATETGAGGATVNVHNAGTIIGGGTGDGINLSTASGTATVNSDAGTLIVGTRGIFAQTSNGYVTVNTSGGVIGTAGAGIVAYNFGTGAASVTSNGLVTSSGGIGIDSQAVSNVAIINEQGGVITTGEFAGLNGAAFNGSVAINANGSVTSDGTAIIGSITSSATGQFVHVNVNDAVSGDANHGGLGDGVAVSAIDSALSVNISSSGSIGGSSENGIVARDSGATLAGTAIHITNDGAIGSVADTVGVRGIDAQLTGATSAGTVLIDGTGSISAATDGIYASNAGSGAVTVNTGAGSIRAGGNGVQALATSGSVSVATGSGSIIGVNGIFARTFSGSGVTVGTIGAVTGTAGAGITAYNFGSGFAQVTANGLVTSNGGAGIDSESTDGVAIINEQGGVVTTGEFAGLTGSTFDASVYVNANGSVTSDGTAVEGFITGAATGASVNVFAGTAVNGDANNGGVGDGISVHSVNSALNVQLASSATIGGDSQTGVLALATGGTLAGTAIHITNNGRIGSAANSVDARGIDAQLTGATSAGNILVDGAGSVFAATDGIFANNAGTGSTTVNVSGGVTSGTYGIRATSISGATNVTTGAGAISGAAGNGIRAVSSTGPVTVTTGTGSVTTLAPAVYYGVLATGRGNTTVIIGTGGVLDGGVDAYSGAGTAGVFAGGNVNDSSGAGIVLTSVAGTATATVATGRTVTGSTDAINATSATGTLITNGGTLNAGTGYAVFATGGAATVNNLGTINGRVLLTAVGDQLNNSGVFNAVGNSDFGAGNDLFTNSGTLRATGLVTFANLEQLASSGAITLVNGVVGDVLTLPGTFVGNNGTLALDVSLVGAGSADHLVVGGAATGSTTFFPTFIGTNTGFGQSILVVDAGAGTSATAFTLAGGPVVNNGFRSYGLAFNAAGNDFYLNNGATISAFRTTAFTAGAQATWYRSADAWNTHMRAVRDSDNQTAPLWLEF